MHQSYGTFLTLCAFLTITPGADTALVLKSAMKSEKGLFVATILGICTGLLFHASLSSLGLSVILRTSAELYATMKFIGAGYLIYLGLRTLYEAWSQKLRLRSNSDSYRQRTTSPTSASSEFRIGLLTNVLNPKVAIFYLTFLPQFVDPSGNILLQSLLLSLIHVVMSFIWLTVIGSFVGYFKYQLEKPRVRTAVESVSGLALLAFGLSLALSGG